jgi:hypothetical protein
MTSRKLGDQYERWHTLMFFFRVRVDFFFFFLLIKGNVSTAHCLIEPILNRQYIS